MNDVKFSKNQFIGSAELNRFKDMLVEDGYKKTILALKGSSGLVVDRITYAENFKIEAGTTSGYIKASSGFAVDSNGNFIYSETETDDIIEIPDDSTEYVVVIAYSTSSLEKGTIKIDSSGNITGADTEFTKILRAAPNGESKVKLYGTSNTGVHSVSDIQSDTLMTLNGSLVEEDDIRYSVYGTFPSHYTPKTSQTEIFVYDSFTLYLGTSVNAALTAAGDASDTGLAFTLAKVTRTGSSLNIKRYTREKDIYRDKFEAEIDSALHGVVGNDLVSVISEKFVSYEDAAKGWNVKFGWGIAINTGDISINPQTLVATITNSNTYVDVAGETNRQPSVDDYSLLSVDFFKGWYLVNTELQWKFKILSSSGSLTLQLDGSYNEDDWNDSGDFFIVPPYDMITLYGFVDDFATTYMESFSINQCLGIVKVDNPDLAGKTIKWYYQMHTGAGVMQTTPRRLINPNIGASNYYTADSYDYTRTSTALKGTPVTATISAGSMVLTPNTYNDTSFYSAINLVGATIDSESTIIRIGNIVYMNLSITYSSWAAITSTILTLNTEYMPNIDTTIPALLHSGGTSSYPCYAVITAGGLLSLKAVASASGHTQAKFNATYIIN